MSRHRSTRAFACTCAVLALFLAPSLHARPADPPVELGAVSWHREFPAAAARARAKDKALLVLFQEVPG